MMGALGRVTLSVETYEQVPYTSKPYVYATAERMAVVGTLFGLQPPDPRTARVLEIGCAGGGNLIPRALVNPGATYYGIDPAVAHVRQAQQLIFALGVDNVEVDKRGVEELSEADGEFDYIIAHGVFSWVPEQARQALMRVCRERLAPGGIAYVSHNTLPGWHMRRMIRDAMLFHIEPFDDAQEKIDQARAMLDFLAQAAPGEIGPYRRLVSQERELLVQQGDSYLFHDHLSPHNEPIYVQDFIAMARDAGLRFLGDAEIFAMLPLGLPQEVQDVLERLSTDIARSQQYLDFLVNQAFRRTLLVHDGADFDRTLRWQRLRSLWVGTTLRYSGETEVPLDPGLPVTFVGSSARELTAEDPELKAGIAVLQDQRPEPMPFDEWIARTDARVAAWAAANGYERALTGDALEEFLGRNLLFGYAQALVELWTGPMPMDGATAERPTAFPFARLQALAGAPWGTSRRHDAFHFDELDRRIIANCDGTRDLATLVAALQHDARTGELVMSADGDDVDPAEAIEALAELVPARLAFLGRIGLLDGRPRAAESDG